MEELEIIKGTLNSVRNPLNSVFRGKNVTLFIRFPKTYIHIF